MVLSIFHVIFVYQALTAAIVKLIDLERDGGVIDRNLIRSCVKIFEQMGMESLEAYIVDLEQPLLISTR